MKKNTINLSKKLMLTASIALLTACGGGGGGSTSADPTSTTDPIVIGDNDPVVITPLPTGQGTGSNTGTFTSVSGLAFRTENTSNVEVKGVISSDGGFTYNDGDTIIFYLGDIEIGRTVAAETLTVMHLVNESTVDSGHPRVRDIMRFLMAVDSDEYYQNGIQIANASHGAADNININLADLDVALNIVELNQIVKIISKTKGFDAPIIDSFTHYSQTAAGVYIDSALATSAPVVTHTVPESFHPSSDPIYPNLSELELKFSKPILSSSVTSTNVTLVGTDSTGTETTVTGKAYIPTGASQGTRIVFKPASALADNTTYTLTASGLIDSSDITMSGTFTNQFTTFDLSNSDPIAVLDSSRLNNSVTISDNSTINIRFSMFDYAGVPIQGLSLDAALSPFLFTEGANQNPIFDDVFETYQGFPDSNQVNSALNMMLLIDNSSSIKDTDFNFYKTELTKLIANVGNSTTSNMLENHQIDVRQFSRSLATVTSGYSNNPLFLLDRLTGTINNGSNSTDLAGALNTAINTLGNNNTTSLDSDGNEVITQKVLVVFSDGVDTAGNTGVSLNNAYSNLINRGIEVYFISKNTALDPLLELGFNQVSSASDILTGIKANIKRDIEDYEKSRYHFQYATPKRYFSTVDVNATIKGNLNLASDLLMGSFNPSVFTDEPGAIKLKNIATNEFYTGPISIAVGAGTDKTIDTRLFSHFLPTTTNYSITSDSATILKLASTSGVANKDNTLEGLLEGTTYITLNDTVNNVVSKVPVYVGDIYSYDFENGSNDLQGWVLSQDWAFATVSADDRKNRSDGALIFMDKINANDSIESPVLDLSRFATSPDPDNTFSGNPTLSFKYKLRTNTLNNFSDQVVVELSTDGGTSYNIQLATLTAFTHDWTDISPISLNSYTNQNNVRVRITYMSDGSDVFEGFMIDDIKISPTR